jgi:hypothetical protein
MARPHGTKNIETPIRSMFPITVNIVIINSHVASLLKYPAAYLRFKSKKRYNWTVLY